MDGTAQMIYCSTSFHHHHHHDDDGDDIGEIETGQKIKCKSHHRICELPAVAPNSRSILGDCYCTRFTRLLLFIIVSYSVTPLPFRHTDSGGSSALFLVDAYENIPLGQRVLPDGLQQPRQRIRNTLGGFYSQNVTLFFRNSPFRVQSELVVESHATLTIETGVQMYFDTGVGLKVFGTIRAIGNEFAHIQMLPYQEQMNYDYAFPDFRLIDGPTVRQGRLQVRFRDRWRSVCTKVTNWTSTDTHTACRSMGYADGAFWRFYRRNNDTYPFVMPRPDCPPGAQSLWKCAGFADLNRIPLTENLCQGEDDIGLYCWGPPTFSGWAKHWKGLQIFSSPFRHVPADPDSISVQRESLSRLEFVDILYAGYDGATKNTTAALYVEGVPPLMNGLRVEYSARDGIRIYEASGPFVVANSTVSHNRGHGIAVDNTRDARFFLNQSIVVHNYGDGVWYRQHHAAMSTAQSHYGVEVAGAARVRLSRTKRQSSFVEAERPRVDMCVEHAVARHLYFPHFVQAHLRNGTVIDPLRPPNICWLTLSLPERFRYSYSVQFIDVVNRNPPRLGSRTDLLVCDGNQTFAHICQRERYRIPLVDGRLPQTVTLPNMERPIFIGLEHSTGNVSVSPLVHGDVNVLFRVHASVTYKAFYGLNITNSVISNNTGNGVQAINVRDRTALSNVTVDGNEGLAGVLIRDGAADVWLNDTSASHNWGDGVNVSYAGGAINVNSSRLVGNRWRGFAFYHNDSSPFWALRHEVVFRGRPAGNVQYPRMSVSGNLWGGILIGNVCVSAADDAAAGGRLRPKVLISWVELADNAYHPAVEIFTCQRLHPPTAALGVDVSGNDIRGGTGVGLRVEPCVNARLEVISNRFYNVDNSALLVRNADHPWLWPLPARVVVAKNEFKQCRGNRFIVSVGLNEDAPDQRLLFDQQNEIRQNTVVNPFPLLKARSTPYAALVVSSSNVKIAHNCFANPSADYEIGVELSEHAKRIDARENYWGATNPAHFMHRIFDQFNRYSLAQVEVEPFAAVCNQRRPSLTRLQQFYRQFRSADATSTASSSTRIGGVIYENSDLPAGRYIVTDDLHVAPGAKLTLAPGTTFEFQNGVGMLVQGELLRSNAMGGVASTANPFPLSILFTSTAFRLPKAENIRLVDESGNEDVLAGRLEVRLDDAEGGAWSSVCNRSWTTSLAQLACHQLGLAMDPEHFENWRLFPPPSDEAPIRMDNIRCEEREFDLTRCRHDGRAHNAQSPLSCRPSEVVGLRCVQPHWAGVRYSLLANPPAITGQPTMQNWIIERAGLFDFRRSIFSAALQIDWNHHVFNALTIRDNFHNGMEIVYNDLTKKPAIRRSYFGRNRRNGIVLRSNGITIENVVIEGNLNAGIQYDPRVDSVLQRDIVSWLDGREQPDLEANNIRGIPSARLSQSPLAPPQRRFPAAGDYYAEGGRRDEYVGHYNYGNAASSLPWKSADGGYYGGSAAVDDLKSFGSEAALHFGTAAAAGPSDDQRPIEVFESQLNHRVFLVARPSANCPLFPSTPCVYETDLYSIGYQYGLSSKLVVQIVNRWNDESDEDMVFYDAHAAQPWSAHGGVVASELASGGPAFRYERRAEWSVRRHTIHFPVVSGGARLRMRYTRSVGRPALIVLVMFLDAQEYVDRFVHVHESLIRANQYAVAAFHYNNLTLVDAGNAAAAITIAPTSAVLHRSAVERLWFQRVNFTENLEAVLWLHSPQYQLIAGTPIAQIGWHVDNCSVVGNFGPIVTTNRDVYAGANVFLWVIWSSTFANNSGESGVRVELPDTDDLRAADVHQFQVTENRFEANVNFTLRLSGFFAFVNISSNNFTENWAPAGRGLVELTGMEKHLVMERNRLFNNWGSWMIRVEATSQSLRFGTPLAAPTTLGGLQWSVTAPHGSGGSGGEIPAHIQYNYFEFNHFLRAGDDYVDMWPRSYVLGVFGTQRVDIHFNRFRNVLMDFELVVGCTPQLSGALDAPLNASHNWWGVANEAELAQRVFDVDDWSTFIGASFSPYYITQELFINFWWQPAKGQLSHANHTEPSPLDLKGRMFEDKTLVLDAERWYPFPYYYRPFRPYRITKDLTIMPGATLTIERNVEVHVWPNVRITVLGNLVADGTLWQPIRFRPINATEFDESSGRVATRYRRAADSVPFGRRWRARGARADPTARHIAHVLEDGTQRGRHATVKSRLTRFRRGRRSVTTITTTTADASGAGALPQTVPFRRGGVANAETVARLNSRRDDVFRQFPEMRRENAALQPFRVLLVPVAENGSDTAMVAEVDCQKSRSGFLTLFNRTSGEMVPSCDRFFTLRNAQVVCRELGFDSQNAYHWLTARWDYFPLLRILKTYAEPRECRGDEPRMDACRLRLTAHTHDWQCVDGEHFNYVHCGAGGALTPDYIGHWGGITFAPPSLDFDASDGAADDTAAADRSVLRHVEIVGGGMSHNDSLQAPALQIIRRAPILENVNVTNSSMDGVQVVAATDNLVLSRVNISANRGRGLSVISANLQSASGSEGATAPPRMAPLEMPYSAPGLLGMCSAGKFVEVRSRILIFYKYDSFPVDCVKIFRIQSATVLGSGGGAHGRSGGGAGRQLGFRFLQVNFYGGQAGLGRADALSIYSDASFAPQTLLRRFGASSSSFALPTATGRGGTGSLLTTMAIHMRATAADGHYGFLAEVTVLPTAPLIKRVDEVAVRDSRFLHNDRAAIHYRNVGEIGPQLRVEQCLVQENGHHLFGNISTSDQAVQLYVHNTNLLIFASNALHTNYGGGLLIWARASSALTQLQAIVKWSAFIGNNNGTAIAFYGNNQQKITVVDNVVALNYALHFDIVAVRGVSTNFTNNLLYNNVGLHTVDVQAAEPQPPFGNADRLFLGANADWSVAAPLLLAQPSGVGGGATTTHTFHRNFFQDNRALGHGFQRNESLGYLPPDADGGERGAERYDEFKRRPVRKRRDVVMEQSGGVSFEWWTHVVAAGESSRYRATVMAGGSPHQKFTENVFNNPLNLLEIVAGSSSSFYSGGSIDARTNYWGYPSTPGVAAGKIRDQADYAGLLRVDYLPVLESNTSLIEGDCPAGWFQAGHEEFKSCFIFVGASMPYADAVNACERLGGFMPILRADDARQREIAARVDAIGRRATTEAERQSGAAYNGISFDVPIWVASVRMPSHQCGWMSSRTASVGEQNCQNLLPFVCEKGTRPYQEPLMWRTDVTLAIGTLAALVALVALIAGLALCKAQRRRHAFAARRNFIRESLRHSRNHRPHADGEPSRAFCGAMPQAAALPLKESAPPPMLPDDAISEGSSGCGGGAATSEYCICASGSETATTTATSTSTYESYASPLPQAASSRISLSAAAAGMSGGRCPSTTSIRRPPIVSMDPDPYYGGGHQHRRPASVDDSVTSSRTYSSTCCYSDIRGGSGSASASTCSSDASSTTMRCHPRDSVDDDASTLTALSIEDALRIDLDTSRMHAGVAEEMTSASMTLRSQEPSATLLLPYHCSLRTEQHQPLRRLPPPSPKINAALLDPLPLIRLRSGGDEDSRRSGSTAGALRASSRPDLSERSPPSTATGRGLSPSAAVRLSSPLYSSHSNPSLYYAAFPTTNYGEDDEEVYVNLAGFRSGGKAPTNDSHHRHHYRPRVCAGSATAAVMAPPFPVGGTFSAFERRRPSGTVSSSASQPPPRRHQRRSSMDAATPETMAVVTPLETSM